MRSFEPLLPEPSRPGSESVKVYIFVSLSASAEETGPCLPSEGLAPDAEGAKIIEFSIEAVVKGLVVAFNCAC